MVTIDIRIPIEAIKSSALIFIFIQYVISINNEVMEYTYTGTDNGYIFIDIY